MPGWWSEDDDSCYRPPPDLVVDDEPNPIVGVLLGPDGEPIRHLLAKPTLPLGFHPGPREPTRIVTPEGDTE